MIALYENNTNPRNYCLNIYSPCGSGFFLNKDPGFLCDFRRFKIEPGVVEGASTTSAACPSLTSSDSVTELEICIQKHFINV